MHLLRDKQVIQLKETTLVRVSYVSSKHRDPIQRVEEKGLDQNYTEQVNEGSASTLLLLHASEMVHHLRLHEYGNLSNLPDLELDSYSDQIQTQFWRCDDDDDNIFHFFQHRPQVILRNITMTRKMNRTPDSSKQDDKCVPFR